MNTLKSLFTKKNALAEEEEEEKYEVGLETIIEEKSPTKQREHPPPLSR